MKPTLKPATREAMDLLLRGSIAMAKLEDAGLRVDLPYLDKAIAETQKSIDEMQTRLRSSEEYRVWTRRYGEDTKIGSREQLGSVIFDILGHKRNPLLSQQRAKKRKKEGKRERQYEDEGRRESNDVLAFEHLKLPFLTDYFDSERMKKALSTYLLGIRREVVDGRLHPFMNLHTVESYRSCIAKGTMIEVVRDVSQYPKGVPIEEVRAGDYAYCYNDQQKIVLKKILWAGKTGHKKIVRLHWTARGKKGHLDLTPEHQIRLVGGAYVAVKDLRWDGSMGTRQYSFVHALAMGRKADRLWETNNKEAILDHRLVYETFYGPCPKDYDVHHKDENHLNNYPSNLAALSNAEHARLHSSKLFTQESREKGYETRRQRILDGSITYASGKEHHNWKHVGKFALLKLLARNGGRANFAGMDFETLKEKAAILQVDLKKIKDRYDANGDYLSLGRLAHCADLSTTKAKNALKIGYYKVDRVYADRGLPFRNHRITRVEILDQRVDVYDLEVEDCHNFIANEICVHNSSQQPNMQNNPVRNKRISQIVRSCIIPDEPGDMLLEADYGQQEVRISYCYHNDPALYNYVMGGADMHKERAMEIYMLTEEELGPYKGKEDSGTAPRYCSKNKFVFPQFYGSIAAQCAPNLWDSISSMKMHRSDGTCLFEHLRQKGITSLGACDYDLESVPGTFEHQVKIVEKRMWEDVFTVYSQWKKDWWHQYTLLGGFNTLTGFCLKGVFRRNQVLCDAIQGAAFHCLLLGIILTQEELLRRKMKSKIILQVHDSALFNVKKGELEEVVEIFQRCAIDRVTEHWKWINIPLKVEFECSSDNWYNKKELKIV